MEVHNTIREVVKNNLALVQQIRRHLHANPELSFQEYKTSEYIKSWLNKWGIPYKDGYVKTGIVASIEGKNPSQKVIALRGDIDALPIQEKNNLEFCSKNNGVMHACGHDVHTASLLGVGKVLHQLKENIEGTVLLVFQPAEEKVPGGAKQMLEEGALSNPKPQIVLGQHVMPGLTCGKIGFCGGKYFASVDEIYLTVKGKGGHAAMPDKVTDTVLMASQIIVAMQQLISRNAPPEIPSVLSFGRIEGLGAVNVVPETVTIGGTFRSMDEGWRHEGHKRIEEIAKLTAKSFGGTCEVEIRKGYPVLFNNEELTELAKQITSDFLGGENVEKLPFEMISEDFAYFANEFPSVFYRLGISSNEQTTHPLHSPYFNIDEEALFTSIATMTNLTYQLLSNTNKFLKVK